MFSPWIPYDPAIDTPLGHRNLVLIYCVVWVAQIAYGTYAVRRWIASRKSKG
ncbi:MAG TPA: hypothetical protein VL495_00665 [Edaphobacter sp.]|jgi:hypothetical protein|nr:hypothetical protein [Edaphobacter sp.]